MSVTVIDSTEVVAYHPMPRREEIATLSHLANVLAHSNRFKDGRNGYEVFAKLLFGRDLGLSATAAMTGVHIVEGKPEIGANIQAQKVKIWRGPEGQRYDYRAVFSHNDQGVVDGCTVTILFREQPGDEWVVVGDESFTHEDAVRAGLASKDNYVKYARNMYFARAMSNATAFHCPEVMDGIRVYAEDEIGGGQQPAEVPMEDVTVIPDDVVTGEVVDDAAEAAPAPPEPDRAPAAAETSPQPESPDTGTTGLASVAAAQTIGPKALASLKAEYAAYIAKDLPPERVDLKLTELGVPADVAIEDALPTLTRAQAKAVVDLIRAEIQGAA